MPPNRPLKIAVTGAGGFLGGSILTHLLTKPFVQEVTALYTKPTAVPKEGSKVRILVGDLRNEKTARDLVRGCDVVLHFANRGIPTATEPNVTHYVVDNLKATGSLLDAMKNEGVKRVVFSSSGGAVYRFDPLRKVPFHENSEIEFRSPYALSKISTEHLLHFYQSSFKIEPVILRISNPYGPLQIGIRKQGFIGNLFGKILNHEEIPIWGSLNTCKDFIYIEDLARLYDSVLQKTDATGIFNIGSGIGVSLREIITTAEKLTHSKLKLNFEDAKPTDSPWTVLNTSKAQRTFSWTCHFSLLDGMAAMWKSAEVAEPIKKAA